MKKFAREDVPDINAKNLEFCSLYVAFMHLTGKHRFWLLFIHQLVVLRRNLNSARCPRGRSSLDYQLSSLKHRAVACYFPQLQQGHNFTSSMGIRDTIKSLAENPYFSAGFGLFGVGMLTAVGAKVGRTAVIFFRRHYVTTLGKTSRETTLRVLT